MAILRAMMKPMPPPRAMAARISSSGSGWNMKPLSNTSSPGICVTSVVTTAIVMPIMP
jgi:hypothetical protein